MTELLLASNNEHKSREFARLFPGVTIRMPGDIGIHFDYPENGGTFLSNAQGKAAALYHRARRPVIADDSGLCVPALGGEPGIFSARYGSAPGNPPLEAARRNEFLLERMAGRTERDAYFICCLVLVLADTRFFAVQETVPGVIANAPRGTNGFGYDPLFILPRTGKTMAELSDEDKDWISHRGRAARRIMALLRDETDDREDR
ncbi:MAG: RdgB/HAM1 family non-canonical purine NTP pyrophosphatase [Spirochaetia bacterium]|jgi:XTP/dITP diphosphohydrolase